MVRICYIDEHQSWGNMARSKGVKRLSSVVALLSSFTVFCWGYWEMFIERSPGGEDAIVSWVAIAFTCSITFIVSWFLVRVIYRVYCEFQEDRRNKKPGKN